MEGLYVMVVSLPVNAVLGPDHCICAITYYMAWSTVHRFDPVWHSFKHYVQKIPAVSKEILHGMTHRQMVLFCAIRPSELKQQFAVCL